MAPKFLAVLVICLVITLSQTFGQTWIGTTSTSWNTASNWSPANVPGTNSDVVISNSTAPFQPAIPSNLTIRDLTISGGTLSLAGFKLTVSRNFRSTGGTISNGTIEASRFQQLQNTRFNNTITLIKSSPGNDDSEGGNIFNGPTTFILNGNGRWRFSSILGDTFFNTSSFQNNSNNYLDIAYSGSTTFAQSITINNTNSNGEIRIGEGGGTSVLANGGLITTSFLTGSLLKISNFTQSQNVPNGVFNINDFTCNKCYFRGDLTIIASDDITLEANNTFERNLSLTGDDILVLSGNNFSTAGGISVFVKNGGNNNDWNGGNTFGQAIFTNNSNRRLRLSDNVGDSFTQNVTFISTSSGAIEPAYNGTSTFSGNISTIGSTQAVVFGLYNGIVRINGNKPQRWQGDVARFPQVTRLQLNTTGSLTLDVPLQINNSLTLTSGIINSSTTNIISLIDNATVASASNTSHVNGPVLKIGNDNFEFPVGNGGFYAPLTLAAGGITSDRYTAQYFRISPVNIPTDTTSRDATIGLMNQTEHWNLSRSSGSINRNLSLSYHSTRTSPIIDFTELTSIHWNGTSWIDLNGAVTGNATAGTVTAGNTSNLGYFTIGNSFRILPIELTEFNGRVTDEKDILLTWATASEKNNAFFTLEKSFDGKNWTAISVLPGAGNSYQRLEYHFLDQNPRYGRQFYRLIQSDFSGESTISQVIGVSLVQEKNQKPNYLVFPNPSTGKVFVESFNINLDEVKVQLVDLNGKVVSEIHGMENTLHELEFTHLPKGIYLLKFYSITDLAVKKLLIQ